MKKILLSILCGGMVACGAPTEAPKKEEKKVIWEASCERDEF